MYAPRDIPMRAIRTITREHRPRRLTKAEKATGRNLRPGRSNARRNAVRASLAGH